MSEALKTNPPLPTNPASAFLRPRQQLHCHLQVLRHAYLAVKVDCLGEELVGLLAVAGTKREAEAPTGGGGHHSGRRSAWRR